MLDKTEIIKNFSRAALTYEANSDVQKEVVQELIHLFTHLVSPSVETAIENAFSTDECGLTKNTRETVHDIALDIGCGTGTIGRTLHVAYPALTLYATDIAKGMVKKARQLYGGSGGKSAERILCAESEALPFKSSTFEYCFSSLVYQWVDDTESAFKEAYRVLRNRGLFIFSTLGPDTLYELNECYAGAQPENSSEREIGGNTKRLAPYKRADVLKEELRNAGFKKIAIKAKRVEKSYSNMFELLGRLKKIGAFRRIELSDFSTDEKRKNRNGLRAQIIKDASRLYVKNFSDPGGGIRATYDVLYVTAVK